MLRLLGAMAGCACLLAVPGDAGACHNTTLQRIDPAVATIGEAERLVDGGNPKEAVRWVVTASPTFAASEPGKSPLGDRALSVLARAAARSGGEHFLGHGSDAPSTEDKQAALAWSVRTLRALAAARPGEPAPETHLAEALAAMPAHQAEARAMLERLARAELVTSPQGYAALAKLRLHTAESQPAFLRAPLRALERGKSELAVSRCEQMTKDAPVCRGAPATPAKPNQGVRQQAVLAAARVDEINRFVTGSRSISVRGPRDRGRD